jgi:hypothetical protein
MMLTAGLVLVLWQYTQFARLLEDICRGDDHQELKKEFPPPHYTVVKPTPVSPKRSAISFEMFIRDRPLTAYR